MDLPLIEFRLAEERDIPFLEKLIPLSVYGLQAGFYSPAQMEGALGTIFAVDSQLIRDQTYFVAEHDNKIVGCGGWSRRKAFYGGDKMKENSEDGLLDPRTDPARVRAFFIDPDYARRGIATEIMRRCESAIVAAGFSKAYIVATLPGEKLYNRFGYTSIDRSEIKLPNLELLPVVGMAKQYSTDDIAH